MYNNLIEKAREFAYKVHKDQKYGDKSYRYHLDGVVKNVVDHYDGLVSNPNQKDRDLAIVCAYLHDTIEDIEFIEREDIEKLFGGEVADSVLMLSRKSFESYSVYIMRVCEYGSEVEKVVKVCDLWFNMAQNKIAIEKGNKHFKHMYDKYSLAEILLVKTWDWKDD